MIRETMNVIAPQITRKACEPPVLSGLLLLSALALAGCDGSSRPTVTSEGAGPVVGNGSGDPQQPATPPEGGTDTSTDPVVVPQQPVPVPGGEGVFDPLPSDLADKDSVYSSDSYGTDDVIRVDLRTVTTPGICQIGDESGCTFADVLADTDSLDDFKPDIAVHFSATDFPDDGTVSNAELRQRGGFTRLAPQKSFRIELDDKDALWRGERKLLLNKHPYESSRIRNAISMSLLSETPHLFSFRTQFANLWIDDGQGAIDYGLFTHVEDPGSRWLERRGLAKEDNLYKAEFFRFSDREFQAIRVDETGVPVNEQQFESLLEIESGDNHSALTKVMEALHDPDRSFESVLDQHFNRNNLQAWLAVNILLHQTDAVTHNYILYNPVGTERFYFVPWDYDGTLFLESEPPADGYSNSELGARQYYGYARNINNVVITRFLQLPGAHERMMRAVRLLRENYLTEQSVNAKAMSLTAAVSPYLQRAPDSDNILDYNPSSSQAFAGFLAGNEEALQTRFSVPMPPTMLEPVSEGAQWAFAWTPAFEVTGNALSYDLEIARSKAFAAADIVARVDGIADASGQIVQRIDAASIGSGARYARVIARAANQPGRFWQAPTNFLREDDVLWYGMVRFDAP